MTLHRIAVRAGVLAGSSGLLWFYGNVPGWGTFTRDLLLDGLSPWPLLGLLLTMVIGYAAGASGNLKSLMICILAIFVAVVVARVVSAAHFGMLRPSEFAGALTLGFTDAGQVRALGGAGDPAWVRIAASATLFVVFAVGVLAGWMRATLREVEGAA